MIDLEALPTKKADDLLFLVTLTRIPFLNAQEKLSLLNKIPDAESLSRFSLDDLNRYVGKKHNAKYNGHENYELALREVNILRAKNIKAICFTQDEYPFLLKQINDPPFVLFYRGNPLCLQGKKFLSVVGTRSITTDGVKETKNFTYEAAKDGCVVVSGLANGVDSAAHQGVLDALYDAEDNDEPIEGQTIAVLPCSADTVVPRNHVGLASKIISTNGCIISELTPFTKTEKYSFIQRNRIIAGLSPATVIMQAPNGSGALSTAELAIDYGRDVFFHKVAFSESATKMRDARKAQLDRDYILRKVSKAKISNSCERYIEAGAPIISDYAGYKNFTTYGITYSLQPNHEEAGNLFPDDDIFN